MHFWSFWAKYGHFLHILSNAQPKNNVNKVPRWVFRYVGNKTYDFSSKKRIFCPKKTKFGPKLAFLVNLGQGMHLVPCWCVGWWLWRAGCISQDTYLLYWVVYYGTVLFHSDQSGGLPLHGDSAMLLHLPQGDPSTGSSRSSGKRALWKICESADRHVRKAKRGFVMKPWWTKLGKCLMWKVPGKRTRWALLAEGTHSTSLHQVSTR